MSDTSSDSWNEGPNLSRPGPDRTPAMAAGLPGQSPSQIGSAGSSALFRQRETEARRAPVAAWVIAGLVILAVLAGLLLVGRDHRQPLAGTVLPLDPYAESLTISGAAMSESVSLSGGKSTFLDGQVRNAGSKTVTGATVQVLFRNAENLPPHVEDLPLALIRTREPYVDTQFLAAAPLAPGQQREFRLIFEALPGNWDGQLPEIRLVHITTH